MKYLGFIGAGNMANAIAKGILKSKALSPHEIILSDVNKDKLEKIKNELKVSTTTDNFEVVENSKYLILAVKPAHLENLLIEIKKCLKPNTVVISIVAGKSLSFLEKILGSDKKIIRTMPNTPALVGEAMIALTPNKNIEQQELESVKNLLKSVGKVEQVDEKLMNAVVGISGSSPAYVFMFIEAMADAGVLAGLPRDKAYTFAAQSVLGSVKMLLETGKHPAILKDAVCSPGGTTIEAVKVLEENGFRAAIMDAVTACVKKCDTL